MVSIITSVYNAEQFIDEMIESVIAQTYKKWELLIIDDCSTDSTCMHINAFKDRRIRLFKNDINEGLTKNLNKLLKIAQGEYVVRIDGDDVMLPNRLMLQIEYMRSNPEVGLSGGWAKAFGQKSDFMCKNLYNDRINVDLLFDSAIIHPTFIMRKSVLDFMHIEYDEELKYAQDYGLEYSFSKCSKIANIDEILIYYRIHNEQISSEKRSMQIECANKTRSKILSDLGLELDDNANRVWFNFCSMIPALSGDMQILKDDIEKIIRANEKKLFWDEEMLKKSINYRLIRYKCICGFENSVFANESVVNEKWIKDMHINKVAIYGAGYVGRVVYDLLNRYGCEVVCYLDRSVEKKQEQNGVAVLGIEDDSVEVDAVIVTPFEDFDAIKNSIQQKIKGVFLSIEELM